MSYCKTSLSKLQKISYYFWNFLREGHSTEEAFVLPTQPSRVRFLCQLAINWIHIFLWEPAVLNLFGSSTLKNDKKFLKLKKDHMTWSSQSECLIFCLTEINLIKAYKIFIGSGLGKFYSASNLNLALRSHQTSFLPARPKPWNPTDSITTFFQLSNFFLVSD